MTAAHTAATAGAPTPGRPAVPHSTRQVAAALYVDLGQAREDRETGRTIWVRPPRARYECLHCRTTEGPVTGPEAVTDFVDGIRTDHRTRCPGPQEHRS